MTKINEAQLIESLKQLKEIKPNKEWASSLKYKILAQQTVEPVRAQFVFANFFSRKLAYSFAAILLLVAGVFGATKLLPTRIEPQQTASLTSQNVAVIKDQINVTVKNIVQNLKENPVQNPQTMKVLAKTLADMPGDMTTSPDVKGLMQTVVESQIIDLEKATLTDEQNETLVEVEDLYGQGKYTEALEKILLINN